MRYQCPSCTGFLVEVTLPVQKQGTSRFSADRGSSTIYLFTSAIVEAELHRCCVEDALGNRGWLLLVSLNPPLSGMTSPLFCPGARAFLRGWRLEAILASATSQSALGSHFLPR